jgi:hypothetical protein
VSGDSKERAFVETTQEPDKRRNPFSAQAPSRIEDGTQVAVPSVCNEYLRRPRPDSRLASAVVSLAGHTSVDGGGGSRRQDEEDLVDELRGHIERRQQRAAHRTGILPEWRHADLQAT